MLSKETQEMLLFLLFFHRIKPFGQNFGTMDTTFVQCMDTLLVIMPPEEIRSFFA